MCWALNRFFISVLTHMIVVSGGSWDFCNCMFCTRCGCKSSGCLDWGHWTVENRWVKGKKIQHCSSMYLFPLLSLACPQEQLQKKLGKANRGLPRIDRADTHGILDSSFTLPDPEARTPAQVGKALSLKLSPSEQQGVTYRGGVNLCTGSYMLVLRGWSYAGVPFQCHQLY